MYTENLRKILGTRFLLAIFLLTLAIPLLNLAWHPQQAVAATATTGTWVKAAATQCTPPGGSSTTVWASINYVDPTKINGGSGPFTCYGLVGRTQTQMELSGRKDSCGNTEVLLIGDATGGGADYTSARTGQLTISSSKSNCVPITFAVDLTNAYKDIPAPSNTIGNAIWTAVNPTAQLTATFTLSSFHNKTEVFDQTAVNGTIMVLTGKAADPANCATFLDTIEVGGKQDFRTDTTGVLTTYEYRYNGSSLSCNAISGIVTLKNPAGQTKSYADMGGAITIVGADSTQKCPFDSSSNVLLNWILCPLFSLGQDTVVQLNTVIKDTLYVNTEQIFGVSSDGTATPTTSPFQTAYNVFRNIGLTMIIMAGLIMVASQAAGLEVFSAYTIRKALPRLVFAAIGMALAWPILQFVVIFFNDMGTWVSDIILNAFGPIQGAGSSGGNTAEYILLLLFGAGAVASAIIGLGALGLLSLIATAALGLIIAYVTLVIRQIVIILCIMLAPIAIAASIVPGTERLWKFWRDTLLGALVMFPIVMGFLAAGAALASVAAGQANQAAHNPSSGGPAAWTFDLIAIIAFFAPYFMIPVAFRMANGLIGNVFGLVNDRGKGVFDRLGKFRQETRARRGQELRAGSLYANRGVGGAINNLGRRTNAGWKGRFGFGSTGRAALSLDSAAEVERTLKSNPRLQQLANDDASNAVLGLSGGTRAGAIMAARRLFRTQNADGSYSVKEDEVRRTVAAASSIGFNRANATAAMTTMAQNKSRAVGAGDIGAVQEGINRLADGNSSMANSLAFGYQFNSRQAGRWDLGGAWHGQENQDKAAAFVANGAPAEAGKTAMETATSMATMLDGFSRSDVSSIVRGHGNEMEQGLKSIDYAMRYGDETQQDTAGHHILELQSALPYSTEENKAKINKALQQYGYRVGDSRQSLATQVAAAIAPRRRGGLPTVPGVGGVPRPMTLQEYASRLDSEARVYSTERRSDASGNPQGTQQP